MEVVQNALMELKEAPPRAKPWRSNEIEPESNQDSIEKLYTRTYKLDVRTVEMGLTQWSGEPVTSDNVDEAVKRFVRETALLPWMKGSAVAFNEGTARLFVRASLGELEMVDAALRVLNDAPQQILVEASWAEITGKPGEGIGLHDLLDVNSRVAPTVHEIVDPAGAVGNGTVTDAIGDSDETVISGAWSMTPGQLKELKVRLEDARADVLTPMRVTTLSGRQTQIKVLDRKSIVTGAKTNPDGTAELVTETVQIGPVLDLLPMASADSTGIRLTATATVKEFLGYLAAPVNGLTPEGAGELPPPKPRLYARKAGTTALVKDGHTLVLGLQEVVRFEKEVGVWREVRNGEVQRTLLIMLTPVMIDPAGNRLNPLP
jgi:type II secretory pathway component GspD/PulD (secretin)